MIVWDVERAFADLLHCGYAGERQEEAEVVGEVGIGAGDTASKVGPSVARMNFALALAVAGLAPGEFTQPCDILQVRRPRRLQPPPP